jgi:hypothetical protein
VAATGASRCASCSGEVEDGANEQAAREARPRSREQVWGWSHDGEGRREELDAAVPRATSGAARDW